MNSTEQEGEKKDLEIKIMILFGHRHFISLITKNRKQFYVIELDL